MLLRRLHNELTAFSVADEYQKSLSLIAEILYQTSTYRIITLDMTTEPVSCLKLPNIPAQSAIVVVVSLMQFISIMLSRLMI